MSPTPLAPRQRADIGSLHTIVPAMIFFASLVATWALWRLHLSAPLANQWAGLAVVTFGLALTGLLTVLARAICRRSRAMEIARHRTHLALVASGTGLWTTDLGTNTTELDECAASIWGLPARRPIPQSQIESRIEPADRSRRQTALASIASQGDATHFDVEYRISACDGRPERWVAVRGHTEFENGKPRRRFGTIRDIAARKAAEKGLETTTLRLTGLIEQAGDAIISIDRDRNITLFNHGAETLFGYPAAEIVGRSLDLLIPTDVREIHKSHIEAFGEGEQPARRMAERGAIAGLRRDGTVFPAEASIARLDLPEGPVFTAIVRDVTDRRRYEEGLEARVAERTKALQAEIERREQAQAALVRSQRMDALGQLTGGIAHDSNNILSVITGNLEMIEDELPGHPALKYLHEAQEAARMGARLNQRLLTFSRRRRLAAQEIHLNDNVIAMSELLRRTLGESITLTTLLAHDLWATRADASEVENAILNLAINARDAMPNGGDLRIETMNVVIEQDVASLEEGFRPGEYVRLSVSDTGTGMAPEVVRRAFEPFYTTKGVDRGTGLGLSTIYGFVKQSGGHVNIYSELGHGTSVNVYLPRIATSNASEVEFAPGQSPPMGQGETILVVEDNPQVRTLTLVRLRRLGYRTLAADNGPTALAVAQDNPTIDLAFSDVVMPGGMSGFELAYKLRQLRPGLAILLTSGFAEDAARSGAQADEDWPVLRKPYAQLDLARKIREALDTR